MGKTIDVNQLSDTIKRNLTVWSEDLIEGIQEDLQEVAKEGSEELKKKSPKRTGQYAKGWTVRKRREARVIQNKDKPQLTHLLEKGHLSRNGRRVKPIKHIETVEEQVIDELERRLEKRIKDGS